MSGKHHPRVPNPPPQYTRIDLEQLKTLHAQRKTDGEIAAITGHRRDSIGRARRLLKLPVNKEKRVGRSKGGTRKKYDYDLIKDMLKREVPAATIKAVVGCSEGPLTNCRKQLGISKPHPASAYAPFEERFAQAEKMVQDHASFADIERTTHINRKVLVREFPGHQWTAQEAGQHAMMIRYGEKNIREAWGEVGTHQRLTNPPGTH